MQKKRLVILAATAPLVAWSAAGSGADLLGLYIGASVGRSDMHLAEPWTDTPSGSGEIAAHHSGWTASVGVRPVRFFGAELQYLDFGNMYYNNYNSPSYPLFPVSTTVHTNAEALFGVLYAPIPVPLLDLYAKVGGAHWHTDVNGYIQGLPCPVSVPQCGVIAFNQTRTDLIYGAGMQFKLGHAALRAEYERINAVAEFPYGYSVGLDPYMYSIGLIWTF